ncbi:exopolysaccharide biosynthesis polyprenyl glycosylphosphotransferase [Jiangella mangrovi]|uniref:Exopolysaccharide biosynthesis polyprenyl glycosylphosphotransferase n=1 Tax=Jiangella mangrovi TaxID=1524084 RepID=A0A7W9GM40_9ACTN|nr:exopolysaccharide biosynthesis polyprenyl glycosylphosphotransferase [Jiangella mangrovi]
MPPATRPFRYRRITAAGDLLTGALAVGTTWALSWSALDVAIAVSVMALAWPLVLTAKTGRPDRLFGVKNTYRDIFQGLAAVVAVLAVAGAVFSIPLLGTTFLAAAAVLAVGSIAVRVAVRRKLRRLRTLGRATRRTLLVGPAAAVADTVERFAQDGEHPLSVVAACVEGDAAEAPGAVPVVGSIVGGLPGHDDALRDEEIVHAVRLAAQRVRARTVCVTPGSEFTGDRLRALSWMLGDIGIDLVTDLGLSDVAAHRMGLGTMGSGVLLHVKQVRPTGLRLAAKVATDRVLAGFILLMLSPLLLTIGLAVKVTDPGPAIYRQVRVGRDGLFFTMLKFRTMYVDADLRRAELLDSADGDGPMFKMRHDPRITSIGRLLRKYSLDELPQLINVLRGDMSLVGPRPALPEEVATYDGTARRRLAAIPGMTGLWQVSGRSNLTWGETVRLDLRYVDNWSYTEDLQLLGRTAGAVVRSTGAY